MRRAAPLRVVKAADKLRAAALGVLKAERHLIDSLPASLTGLDKHPHGKLLLRQLANVEQEENWWLSATIEEIIEKHSSSRR